MTHVITQSCGNEAACGSVCPVDCIQPRPDEATISTADSPYIDAEAWIERGAYVEERPVGAVSPDEELNDTQAPTPNPIRGSSGRARPRCARRGNSSNTPRPLTLRYRILDPSAQ